VLITKDSGGEHTAAKLQAARLHGLPVIVVSRPPTADSASVGGVAEVLAWLDQRAHAG